MATAGAEAALNIVGFVGILISFGLFLSPVPTFHKIIEKKSVEEFKPDPYIATTLNCMYTIFVHPHSLLLITINGFGLVLQFIYLAIFYAYADKKGRKKMVDAILFVAVVALIAMMGLHGTSKRSLMVGLICNVFNVIMYASPLTIMAKVIKTKSVEYMPFALSLTHFLNGCVWTAYALIKLDIYSLISNGLGAICGLVQLVLYACYFRATPSNNGKIEKPAQLQLSNMV